MQVSPFHASVLMHFQTRPEWPAAELAEQMGVEPDVLRRKVVFWINQGEGGGPMCEGQRKGMEGEGGAVQHCNVAGLWGTDVGSSAALQDRPGLAHLRSLGQIFARRPARHLAPPPAGVLSESRAPGQALPVYRRNEQLQTGPALGGDQQEGMELEEGGADQEHQVGGRQPGEKVVQH